MLIKCKNCSRTYNLPDEKWQILRPRFFKCSACGEVFEAPLITEPKKETENKTVMPLAEIFQQENNTASKEEPIEADSSQQDSEEVKETFVNTPSGSIFEPILQTRHFFSKLVIATTACLVTFFSITLMFYLGRTYFDKTIQKSVEEKIYTPFIFQNTKFDLGEDKTLSVTSRLINTSDSLQKTPRIVVLLKSKNDLELQREYVLLRQRHILPKQSIDFHVNMTNIHPDSFKIEIITEDNKK